MDHEEIGNSCKGLREKLSLEQFFVSDIKNVSNLSLSDINSDKK